MTFSVARERRIVLYAWLMPLLVFAVGCSGASGGTGGAEAPAGGSGAGAGLSGEMRNVIMGNVGTPGTTVGLYVATGETCDTRTTASQTTVSNASGDYQFPLPVQPADYCIGFGDQTVNCHCDWSLDTCPCSKPRP